MAEGDVDIEVGGFTFVEVVFDGAVDAFTDATGVTSDAEGHFFGVHLPTPKDEAEEVGLCEAAEFFGGEACEVSCGGFVHLCCSCEPSRRAARR